MIEGWDDKIFNRSGDLVPVAIIQSLSDDEMTSSQTLEEVLLILRDAYACARCVTPLSDREPRVALLLLNRVSLLHDEIPCFVNTRLRLSTRLVVQAPRLNVTIVSERQRQEAAYKLPSCRG
jgi:hypothetical protein